MPGHDVNYLGLAGILSLGLPGEGPLLPGVQVADLGGGGMLGAVGILAALVRRSVTGRGGFVDAAMLDGVVSWLSIHAGIWLGLDGAWPPGGPMLSGGLACYRVYRTGDGRHLTVGALEPRFWATFCETLGVPDLVERQFEPDAQSEMTARVQEALLARGRDEWVETFRGLEACVGPVNDVGEALADPQVRHRGMVAEIGGVPRRPRVAASAGRTLIRRPAPGTGARRAHRGGPDRGGPDRRGDRGAAVTRRGVSGVPDGNQARGPAARGRSSAPDRVRNGPSRAAHRIRAMTAKPGVSAGWGATLVTCPAAAPAASTTSPGDTR